MPPAARITDPVSHPLPPVLTGGPGSMNTIIGMLPAWRGIPAAMAAALDAMRKVSDAVIKTAEAATVAAAGTPGAPAAKAAEEAAKATAAATMGSAISGMAGGMSDIHACTTPLPIPPHGPGLVVDGSPTVLINNMPACRQGDTIVEAVGPPNKIAMGCVTVLIGNSGSGGGGGGGGAAGAAAGAGAGAAGGAAAAAPPAANIAGMPVSVLPNGDVQVGKSITITGDLEFKMKTLFSLGQIASTPTGEKLLKELGNGDKPVKIQKTTGGNSCSYPAAGERKADGTPGPGSGSTVNYNPDKKSLGPADWQTRPPAIALAHELIHSTQAAKGTMSDNKADNDNKPDPTDPTKKAQTYIDELETVGIPPHDGGPYTENKIREEWPPPQPKRPWY
ncbi:MAG: PAAR domain-containing protein [Bryobacteraceae bacterium]|nr:PAAR domain-containing protein [Bryobacteraceae bacterium]